MKENRLKVNGFYRGIYDKMKYQIIEIRVKNVLVRRITDNEKLNNTPVEISLGNMQENYEEIIT